MAFDCRKVATSNLDGKNGIIGKVICHRLSSLITHRTQYIIINIFMLVCNTGQKIGHISGMLKDTKLKFFGPR